MELSSNLTLLLTSCVILGKLFKLCDLLLYKIYYLPYRPLEGFYEMFDEKHLLWL